MSTDDDKNNSENFISYLLNTLYDYLLMYIIIEIISLTFIMLYIYVIEKKIYNKILNFSLIVSYINFVFVCIFFVFSNLEKFKMFTKFPFVGKIINLLIIHKSYLQYLLILLFIGIFFFFIYTFFETK